MQKVLSSSVLTAWLYSKGEHGNGESTDVARYVLVY